MQPEGRIDLVLGTLSSGQGHATSFAQLLVEWLGVALADVRLITGDTDVTVTGGGAHSARALRLAAIVMAKASDQIVDKGRRDRRLAAGGRRGRHRVLGPTLPREGHRPLGRSLRGGRARRRRPASRGRSTASDETMPPPSFPYGCAVCEVEVDPDTGVVDVVRYTTVDDCGRAVNPMILHGQTHGGIAQGVGQALWESCAYDAETGQLLSPTLMDYALPRADMLPSFTTEISEVPSTSASARPARRRRGRDDPGARRRGQRDRRRAGRAGRRAHRAAGDPRARVAGDPGRAASGGPDGVESTSRTIGKGCPSPALASSRARGCARPDHHARAACRRPGHSTRRAATLANTVTLAPTWFDPRRDAGRSSRPSFTLYAIHDALVKPMPGNAMAPSLAESWTVSKDSLVYEFVLRKGVQVPQRRSGHADDVKFSFERYQGARRRDASRRAWPAVDIVDPQRIRFRLKQPWPDFMTFYGTPATGAGWIVPEEVRREGR